jgi:hypothetical protein
MQKFIVLTLCPAKLLPPFFERPVIQDGTLPNRRDPKTVSKVGGRQGAKNLKRK